MSTVTPVQGAASLLLQQAILVPASHSPAATTEVETVTAVQPVEPISRHEPVTAQARSKVYEALLDAESANLPAIKLRLIENVAGALGINQENYGSDSAFRAAIRAAFDELAMNPHAREIIAGLPRNLGLDNFGASLKQAADAAAEARRVAAERAEARKAEEEATEAKAAAAPAASPAEPPAGTKTEAQATPPRPTPAPKAESSSATVAAPPVAEAAPAAPTATEAPAPAPSNTPAAA